MLMTLCIVIVLVFLVICAWSAFEIYLEKRKKPTTTYKQISQTTDENQ
ncbi:hypothetical protein [Acinetobacter sp. P8-3-8]|nr:hypothetical protein [Acinetobacter sp. P8-3-8]